VMTYTQLKTQILKTINLCSSIHKNHKTNILNKLIVNNQDLAPQGSPEWLALRVYNIGGSEMSTITGENCFSSIDKLVAQKIGFSHFGGNMATRWGNLFEFVTQQITEIIFDISDGIHETGSLEGAVPNQRYSPDGLAVIKMKCIDINDGQTVKTDEYCIVLFEFKSPLYSIPTGSIPKYYLPQVKTGLCSIPITDFAIFISNMFRKCSFSELGLSTDYDVDFHNRDAKRKFIPTKPLAFGMILFYQTKQQQIEFYKKYNHLITYNPDDNNFNYDSDDSDGDAENVFGSLEANTTKSIPTFVPTYTENVELYKYIHRTYADSNNPIRDFGKSYYRDFNDILQLFDDKYLSVKYCVPHILGAYNTNAFLSAQGKTPGVDDYSQTIKDYKNIIKSGVVETGDPIIGYLPWKMMKSDIVYEPRDSMYVKNQSAKIQETIQIIQKINTADTEVNKLLLFKEHFPKSKILKDEGLDNAHIMEFLPKNI
jgi:hypothetical protein